MPEDALLLAAIEDNIAWCSSICASHHSEERNLESAWVNLAPSPPFYPNIITRRPNAEADVVRLVNDIRQNGASGAWGIKDSFHDLDLAGLGFSPVIEGQWFGVEPAVQSGRCERDWDIVRNPEELSLWEKAWDNVAQVHIFKDALLEDARIRFWVLRHDTEISAGCISFSSGSVTGLSNWFSRSGVTVFDLGILHPVAEIACREPIVFWASEDDAAFQKEGFKPLGALRVWTTESVST
jgi:hypothetical protein